MLASQAGRRAFESRRPLLFNVRRNPDEEIVGVFSCELDVANSFFVEATVSTEFPPSCWKFSQDVTAEAHRTLSDTKSSTTTGWNILTSTDEEIIAAFQASGDATTLDALIGRHLERVRNLAYRLVLCDAAADDITQDVFMKVIRGANTFRGDAKFSTWLYRITVNAAREHLRKKPLTTVADVDLPGSPSEAAPVEADAMRSELLAAIEHGLGKLSVKLRAAIVLTAIEGLTVKEAADI